MPHWKRPAAAISRPSRMDGPRRAAMTTHHGRRRNQSPRRKRRPRPRRPAGRGAAATWLTAGPPAAQAGGILTVDLGAIWSQLARARRARHAGRMRGRDQGRRLWLRPRAGRGARWRGPAARPFSSPISARRGACAPSRRAGDLRAQRPAAGHRAPAFAEIRARPVIGSLVELAEWDAFCTASGWRGGAALHVDTGMNRLGVTVNEAAALAPRIRTENHGITLLMSHLACAEMPEHPLNERQIAPFREVRLLYRGIPSSLANSSGIFLGNAAHCDMVRPGVALYGVNPTPGRAIRCGRWSTLQARIVQVRTVPRGETVGYDAAWTARACHPPRGGRGRLCRRLSARRERRRRGARRRRHRRRQALPAGRPRLHGPDGDRHHRSARQRRPARRPGDADRRRDHASTKSPSIAGTIGYEVLTSLGRRYHRVYREA